MAEQIIEAAIDLVVMTIEAPDRHAETRIFSRRVTARRTLP
jgi:AmiR/NasT family two-component response regulator